MKRSRHDEETDMKKRQTWRRDRHDEETGMMKRQTWWSQESLLAILRKRLKITKRPPVFC